jgi:1-deoxy-D-xylulose-5-phosphate synthase
MLYTAYEYKGPAAVRYPRGTGPGAVIEKEMTALPIGRGVEKRQGQKIAILAFGASLTPALKAAESLNASVADMRFVKPLDETLICSLARTHELLVTVEEHAVMGGAGSAVNEFLARENLHGNVLNLGIPDVFIEHASPAEMLAECGLDAAGIEAAIRRRMAS